MTLPPYRCVCLYTMYLLYSVCIIFSMNAYLSISDGHYHLGSFTLPCCHVVYSDELVLPHSVSTFIKESNEALNSHRKKHHVKSCFVTCHVHSLPVECITRYLRFYYKIRDFVSCFNRHKRKLKAIVAGSTGKLPGMSHPSDWRKLRLILR